jgi:hypothetical protein
MTRDKSLVAFFLRVLIAWGRNAAEVRKADVKYILTLDAGTTSVRAVLVDRDGGHAGGG